MKISSPQGSTSTMRRHLLSVHRIDADKNEAEVEKKKVKTLDCFMVKESLEEMISKLAAEDGFTIRKITTSKFIRQSFSLRGMSLPADEKSVMSLIYNFQEKIKLQVINDIKKELSSFKKFSITLDEWTSIDNRRFININLHKASSKIINLGLVRILGSCNAEKMNELVEEHLSSFGLSFYKDIVASTGDGASVMIKFGRISPAIYQVCLDHGLHLAVSKTFYVEKILNQENIQEASGEIDDFDDDNDDKFSSEGAEIKSESIKENLNIVRKVVNFFKGSAIRSDSFKAKCKEKFGKEQQLKLDVKTRWNSMLKMVEVFIKLYDVTKEVLFEFGCETFIENLNLELLKSLVYSLKPVEVTINAISEKNSTLRTAYVAIKFLKETLAEQDSEISRMLLQNIDYYMNDRINQEIMELMLSLWNLDKIPKNSIGLATNLMKRLFPTVNNLDDDDAKNDNLVETINNNNEVTYEEQLKLRLQASSTQPAHNDRYKKLTQEFSLSKSNGELTENLKRLSDALSTIKPTSIDSERAFSVASNFCSKLRSKLSDKSLHTLVFLKYHFINKEN